MEVAPVHSPPARPDQESPHPGPMEASTKRRNPLATAAALVLALGILVGIVIVVTKLSGNSAPPPPPPGPGLATDVTWKETLGVVVFFELDRDATCTVISPEGSESWETGRGENFKNVSDENISYFEPGTVPEGYGLTCVPR